MGPFHQQFVRALSSAAGSYAAAEAANASPMQAVLDGHGRGSPGGLGGAGGTGGLGGAGAGGGADGDDGDDGQPGNNGS